MNNNILINTSANNPVKGILEQTEVTKVFFSDNNKSALQKMMKYQVYTQFNNTIISDQSEEQLFIIMRSMLLQYGNLLNPDVIQEVKSLNKYVLDFAVNRIISELIQYTGYINDIDSTPQLMPLPDYVNKNNFTYSFSPGC
tara:strand:+ start:202 stop:624 length:423 start_codon:yes stop_codon:yes gene_type:complete